MQIDLHEKLASPLAKEEVHYLDGKLQHLTHYQQGVLHGPAVYCHENGNLLSQGWFWKGLQQGKMWTYYPDGALHSLQRFKDGYWEGMQQYYFGNGFPKSIFSYHNRVLHGDVLLYHATGQLARSLHFHEGRREGVEQIWDESGTLRIEAHYVANRPVGIARQWHDNGELATEVVYDQHSNFIEKRSWSYVGVLIPPEEQNQEDYFDKVTSQIDKFTQSLDDVLVGMKQTFPMLSQGLEANAGVKNGYGAEFERLRKEMDKLRDLSHEMQGKFDDENPKEAIWKSPLAQLEMDRHLTKLSQQVNADLSKLEGGLKDLLGQMLQKLEKEKGGQTPPPPKDS